MEINRENARAVHDQILLHPATHAQHLWISSGYSADSCGTTACVAGWGAMLDPRNEVLRVLEGDDDTYYDDPQHQYWYTKIIDRESGDELSVNVAGERAFGLDGGDQPSTLAADWLFDGDRTRREVLHQLDHMATTGEFDHTVLPQDEEEEEEEED